MHEIYYRISYSKFHDFANLMKIMMKNDISSLYLTFCHEFFMESLRVFSYAPGISFSLGKHVQHSCKLMLASSGEIFLQKSTSRWFIAWHPHIWYLRSLVSVSDLFFSSGPLIKKQQFLIVESTMKLIVESTIKNGNFGEFTSAYISEKGL